ncbi:unknown protein [Rivularia sp. IAM M-261]|nr:unknown protein [Rivularia sp. IAM M-261]
MKSIKLNKKVGTDGILHLDIPVEIIDDYVEIMVIYQPLQPPTQPNALDDLGYPPGFFEQTYGSCADDPIVIDSEGEFEERETIL